MAVRTDGADVSRALRDDEGEVSEKVIDVVLFFSVAVIFAALVLIF